MTAISSDRSSIPHQIVNDLMLMLAVPPDRLRDELVHQSVAPGRYQIAWRSSRARCVEYVLTGNAFADQYELQSVAPLLVKLARP